MALRRIVRRDTGESYVAFLTRLAQASSIETPSREDLARLDLKYHSQPVIGLFHSQPLQWARFSGGPCFGSST